MHDTKKAKSGFGLVPVVCAILVVLCLGALLYGLVRHQEQRAVLDSGIIGSASMTSPQSLCRVGHACVTPYYSSYTVRIEYASTQHIYKIIETKNDGTFVVSLPAGTYTLVAGAAMTSAGMTGGGTAKPVTVTVPAHVYEPITITFFKGIY